ncbi:hypothetical protein ABKV19_008364 [Rosa sericea]
MFSQLCGMGVVFQESKGSLLTGKILRLLLLCGSSTPPLVSSRKIMPVMRPAAALMARLAPKAKKWSEIIGQARQSVEVLKDQEVIRTVLNILQAQREKISEANQVYACSISLVKFLGIRLEVIPNAQFETSSSTLPSQLVKLIEGWSLFKMLLVEEI